MYVLCMFGQGLGVGVAAVSAPVVTVSENTTAASNTTSVGETETSATTTASNMTLPDEPDTSNIAIIAGASAAAAAVVIMIVGVIVVVQQTSRSPSFQSFSRIFYVVFFNALHRMQTRSSDENSVCPSVCLSHAWIVTKR